MSRRPRLDPAVLRELSRVSDAWALVDLVVVWAIVAGALALAHGIDRWWAYALAVVIVASRQNALATLAHDGSHRLCLRNPVWNHRLAAWAYAYPVGIFYHHDRQRHLRHHREVGERHDPDWGNYSNEGRATPAGVLRYLLGSLCGRHLLDLIRRVLRPATARGDGDGEETRAPGPGVSFGREVGGVAVCQLALFAAFTAAFEWWTYPLLWVLPLATVASFLVDLRALIEHAAADDDAPGEARLRDFAASPLEAFLLSPSHFHFHALHHAFVSIPHRNLPKARAALAAAHGGRYPLEVWPGYLRSLRLHVRSLRDRAERDAGRGVVAGGAVAGPGPTADVVHEPVQSKPVEDELRQPAERQIVSCEHCGASEGEPVTGWLADEESAEQLPPAFRGETFRFIRCAGCGLVYMRERPNPADLDVYYGGEYKCFTSFRERGALMRFLAELVARQKRRQIEGLLPPGNRRLLDYGCGSGTWLELLQGLGTDLEMMGCDVTEVAVERVRRLGLPAWVGDESTLLDHVEPGSVGVIHLFHVIEHVPDAGRCLRALYEALAPGGAVVGQTPNVASVGCRFWGDHWDQWHVPRHLVLFDHRTLRRAAERAGFEGVEIRNSLSGATQWALSALAWWAARRGRPFRTGHEPLYPPLILAFLPVTAVEALLAHTCHMDFVLRKPADAGR